MYTKQAIDAWLGPLTDPKLANAECPIRKMLSRVWTVQWDGRTWAMVTDGKSLVAVAGFYGYEEAPDKEAKRVLAVLGGTGRETVVSLDTLREWTGPPPDCKLVTCSHCGSRLAGVEIPESEWCKDCGQIGGLLLDRRRLAHVLRGCRDQEVNISVRERQLDIHSANMAVALMGVNREVLECTVPDFKAPVFKLSAEKG